MPKVTILSQNCKGVDQCGICKYVCPKDLYEDSKEMNSAGYVPPAIPDDEACTACENCMIYCPDMAIVVHKNEQKAAPEQEGNDD
jgi:2-oxoglutarate ferredoxin oxidoreductase subunit delta